ncbi:MAG TPA: 30S ribosomal protein S17 [Myxococcota bacterium]|jgi:small subunit ribosomal protein S17|nr:30S ribosomal protein S17 [Myxococcota bacterium]
MSERGNRRALIGVVTSDKMTKTVVVQVTRRVLHERYQKYVLQRTKYKAHDEKNEAKAGDTVEIVESRPLSRDKRWRVSRVVQKAVA